MAEADSLTVPLTHSKEVRVGTTDGGGEIVMVGGPRPYLWIGDRNGKCIATIETALRDTRNAITEAIRRA